jgi:hypothetical protein
MGQVASSGTSGGAEAKGDLRFAGAGRTCVRCPPATHWAAEPTRDSAPRRPDRRIGGTRRAPIARTAHPSPARSSAQRRGARSADLYCRLGFTRRRSGSVVARRRRCGRPRTLSRKPRRSTRTQSIRRRSRPRMQPRWRRKRGDQLPTSRPSCRRSVATWRCRTCSAQLPEGPERLSATVRLHLAAPGPRHTHCPLRAACARPIVNAERRGARSASLKEWGRVKEMFGVGVQVGDGGGLCGGRASPPEPGSGLAAGHPGGAWP